MKDMFWQGGQTPLYVASENNNIDVVKFLLDKGGNIHAATNVSNIILYACCCVYYMCYNKVIVM